MLICIKPLLNILTAAILISASFCPAATDNSADLLRQSKNSNLISAGSVWQYYAEGCEPADNWQTPTYNSADWSTGQAQLGFGDNDEATQLPGDKMSYYFRRDFNYEPQSSQTVLFLRILRDDGAVVYLNGTEIVRSNMPSGIVNYNTPASSALGSSTENLFVEYTLPLSGLLVGNNLIAVEVHQNSLSSSDVGFDLELSLKDGSTPTTTIPFLHFGSTGNPLNGLTVSWQGNGELDSIRWGYQNTMEKGSYPAFATPHYNGSLYNYNFNSVEAAKTIHYQIYNSQAGQWSSQQTFQTAADPNSKFTFTAGGDTRNNLPQWRSFAGKIPRADFSIFPGDLVNSGNDQQYWTDWMEAGKEFFTQNLVYYSQGNHDVGNIYRNALVMPGNEYYYSFTYGNTLVISMHSEDRSNLNGAQYTFLKSTLEANADKTWKIVFFHRPIFNTGNHAGDMNSVLSTWWKTFDDYGVDLVLNCHVHCYSRTKPLNRNVSTSEPMEKYGSGSNDGRCQMIVGSYSSSLYDEMEGWWVEETKKTHNYTHFEVEGNTMTMKAYDGNQQQFDSYTFTKDGSSVNDLLPLSKEIMLSSYPNPFNPRTSISFTLPREGQAVLKIYSAVGQLVREIQHGALAAGKHSFDLDVGNLSSGVYFCRLESAAGNAGCKIVLSK